MFRATDPTKIVRECVPAVAAHTFPPLLQPGDPDYESWGDLDEIERLLEGEDPDYPRLITPPEIAKRLGITEGEVAEILDGLEPEVTPVIEDDDGQYYSIFTLADVSEALRWMKVGGDWHPLDAPGGFRAQ